MQALEIVGVIVGLLYLYLEYKASRWLWPVGVLMPIVYVWIFFQSKFYADMGINIYYFFASIYGWWKWTKHSSNTDNTFVIRHTPSRQVLPMVGIGLLLFGFISFILVRYTDSPVPYGDSLTTALSIVGMWMLAQKYVEQWGVWFLVNIISSSLYVWKELYFTAGLFGVYAVISVFGYIKWRRMAQQNAIK